MSARSYLVFMVVAMTVFLAIRPGTWLVDKAADTNNPQYVKGWENGCLSGANSFSVLYPLFLDKPFVKYEPSGLISPLSGENNQNADTSDFYKNAWNEGYTICRFYQASVRDFLELIVILVTVLFVGLRLPTKLFDR
jgi:hypothetical protein